MASGDGPLLHADGLRGRHARGYRAEREPRRSYPRGLSEHRPNAGGGQRGRAQTRRWDQAHQGAAAADAGRVANPVRGGEVSATKEVTMRIWRGTREGGAYVEYTVPIGEGMVV